MATVRLHQLAATVGGTAVRLYQLEANVPPDAAPPPTGSGLSTVRLYQLAAQATPVGTLTAYAGVDRTVSAFDGVTLDGTGSPGVPDTYVWTQTAGPTVELGGSGAIRTFTVPGDPLVTTTYTFRLTVANMFGSAADTVTFTVPPHPFRVLTPTGWKPRPLFRVGESAVAPAGTYTTTYSDTY